jgi:hypothetical protein
MTHVRTQIRERFKTELENRLPSGQYEVFASRKYAINNKPDKAVVDIRISNDQTMVREVMYESGNGPRIHTASLYVRVQRTDDESQIDDSLDVDEVNIVNALSAVDWSDLLEEPPELLQVNFADDERAGRILGVIILRFDCEYRIDASNPELVIA